MAAARGGHEEIVGLLLESGASVELRARNGETALFKAAAEGRTKLVERLAAAGADVHVADERGRSALTLAAEGAFSDLIECLLRLGATLDAQEARRLMTQAEQQGLTDVVTLLSNSSRPDDEGAERNV